jgi:hypothetical protein
LSRLSYRLQKLEESMASNGKEVGLGEIIHWLYRRYGPRLELDEPLPLTPDEQRQYDDYRRRCETSKLVLWLAGFSAARGEADRLAQAQEPTSVDRLIESESVPEPVTAFGAAPSPEDAAIAFLKTRLGDGKPHPVVQVHNDADAAGVDPDALHRARNMLPIETRSGPGRPSTWTLELDEAPAPPDVSRNDQPAVSAPEPEPAAASSRGNSFWERGHVYEPDRNGDVLVPQPGMSLAALMAHSRKSDSR